MGRFSLENNSKSVPQPPVLIPEAKLKEIFRKLDVNGDGVICSKELRMALKDWGASYLSERYRAHNGLRCADRNKDGVIDAEEFDDFVKYVSKHGYEVK